MRTRLPSKIRQATRECVHLVTRGRFRSRDKDGRHTTGSVISEDLMVQKNVNFTNPCFIIELELLAIEFLRYGNLWQFLAPVNLTLTRWPSYTNMTRCIPWSCTGWAKMNFLHQSSRKLSS